MTGPRAFPRRTARAERLFSAHKQATLGHAMAKTATRLVRKRAKKVSSTRKPGSKAISVFISYSHDDYAIAKVLKDEIDAIDHTGFNVFLDVETIELSNNWKVEIKNAVEEADVFIAIFTGNQKHVFDYCGYEVGLFSGSPKGGKRRRMFCIYDTKEPPTILNDLESVQISYDMGSDKILKSTDGWLSEAFAPRMKDVFKLCDQLYFKRHRKQLADLSEAKSREVIQAFYANKGEEVVDERPLHERLIITLPAVTDWNAIASLPPTATVSAVISTFDVLGLPGGVPQPNKEHNLYSIDWKTLVENVSRRAGNVVPWITYVETSILAQLRAGNSQPPQLSFLGADGKPYRPVIGRFKVYRNGTRRYYVQLIPTLERAFPGREDTSFPLIGLIFGARFWFKFCENEEAFIGSFAPEKADAEFDLEVRSMDSYLQRMIAEAGEFGLADRESMKRFMKVEDASLVDHFFAVWQASYGEISALFKRRLEGKEGKREVTEGIEAFVEAVKPINMKFMNMMFKELLVKLMTRSEIETICGYRPGTESGGKSRQPDTTSGDRVLSSQK
jgi:hypothetical protein